MDVVALEHRLEGSILDPELPCLSGSRKAKEVAEKLLEGLMDIK